jgi:hypothetical protein
MPGRPATVTHAEVARLLKAARDAGRPVQRIVHFPDGRLELHCGDDAPGAAIGAQADPWAARIAQVKE